MKQEILLLLDILSQVAIVAKNPSIDSRLEQTYQTIQSANATSPSKAKISQ